MSTRKTPTERLQEDCRVFGELTANVHVASYTLERAFSGLKLLLTDNRWKNVGTFADVNAFLDSVRLDNFRMLAEQRKDLARQIKQLQPDASNRRIANVLGADESTIRKDFGAGNPAGAPENSNNSNGEEKLAAGFPAPPALTGAEAYRAVERAEQAAERKEKKEQAKQVLVTGTFSEDGPFGTVVIDPPWEMEKIDRTVRPNQAAFDYPTMGVDQLLEFWIKELAPRLESDAHVFMWTTQKWLSEAIRFVGTVGLKHTLTMVWHKPGGFQPVGLPQFNCEFVVYARRGAPVFVDTKNFNCCFDGERREHSRKPDEFYDTVRRVTGGSRIDVFSREPREGFAQYGDEMGKFSDVA